MRIRVEDLRHHYPGPVVALDGVSATFRAGEMVAIVGENGAGKTTLVKHLNGLLKPTAGTVRVGETYTTDITVAGLARRVGYVFQNPDDQLFSRTVRQEVAVGPRNLGLSDEEVEAKVGEALEVTGLEGMAGDNPYDLAPTERKLVALASVLAMDPPLLVVDEPTLGQDGAGTAHIGRILRERWGAGKGVIAITHDIDFAAETFERMLVMSGGRILGDGPTSRIVEDFELLGRAAVEPPQLTRLARDLSLGGRVYDQRTFLERLSAARHRGGQPR